MPDLSVDLNGLRLRNPVITASGTCGYGLELADYLDLSELGAVAVKGISLRPHEGNPPQRIAETPSGMLNAIGLQNVGAEVFAQEKLPRLRELGATVIVNVWGNETGDFTAVVERLEREEGIAAFELNISCPNISREWIQFGVDPELTYELVKAVRGATGRHLMVKLSPNVTDITAIGLAAQEAGADSLSAVNTLLGLEIDLERKRPALWKETGGLSGPAIRPVALRCVWQLFKAVRIPVVGIGGIFSVEDVVKFFYAGASAVQVGTATFIDPTTAGRLVGDLDSWCREKDVDKVSRMTGAAHRREQA
jgi:dihydroorotate dehydrogenase (NAD+) catalytic subunit